MFLSYRHQLLVHDLVLAWDRFLVTSFEWSETCKGTGRLNLQVGCLFLPLVVLAARAGLIVLVIVQGLWRLLPFDEPEKGEEAFIKALD